MRVELEQGSRSKETTMGSGGRKRKETGGNRESWEMGLSVPTGKSPKLSHQVDV